MQIEAVTSNNEIVSIKVTDQIIRDVLAVIKANSTNEKRFDVDLARGKVAENAVARILNIHDDSIEIKKDSWVSRTGNVAVEFMSRNKPSGISTSTATWWAFMLGGSKYNNEVIVFVKRARLLRLVTGAPTKKMGDRDGSEQGVAEAFLLPVTKLVEKLEGESE